MVKKDKRGSVETIQNRFLINQNMQGLNLLQKRPVGLQLIHCDTFSVAKQDLMLGFNTSSLFRLCNNTFGFPVGVAVISACKGND